MKNKLKKKVKGSVLVFLVILFPLLFLFAGITIDTWNVFLVRNQMQTATDAAALAGAVSLNTVTPGNVSTATTKAKSMATSNTFTNGTNSATVTVTIPPGNPYSVSPAPSYASNSSYVRVQISQPVKLQFGSIMGITTMTVSTNAVAGPTGATASIVTLSTSAAGSLNMSGSPSINAISGTVNVNSSSSSALTLSGGPHLTAGTINVVGGTSIQGTVTGTVNTNASAASNPFASLTLPSASSCTATGYSVGNATIATLSPGTYCGGMSIQGSAVITLNPGTYILNGGGLNVGNNASLIGVGVTFYNTGTSSGADIYGPFNVGGSGVVTLTAPTTGTYTGMLFIQDPLNTQQFSFNNGATGYMAGNIYLPNASINFAGSGIMTQPLGIIVVQNLIMSGAASIQTSTQYGGGSGGSGQMALYE